MKIFFLRHGESIANVEKVFCHKGCSYGLTEKGRKEVKKFLKQVRNVEFNKIYSSPLVRSVETAKIISEEKKTAFETTEALYEIDVGILEGKCEKDCWLSYRNLIIEWLLNRKWEKKIEGGESFFDMLKRFLPFIESIKSEYSETNANILLVGHNGLYKSILPYILSNINYKYAYDNNLSFCEYAVAELKSGRFVCLKWGKHSFWF